MTVPGGTREPRRFGPDFLTELFSDPLDPGYADAAARRARDGAAAGWRNGVVRGVSALTLLAVGFLLAVAYKQTDAEAPARTKARTTLVEQVLQRRLDTDTLQARADALRADVTGLRERQLGARAVARLRNLEAATGLAKVRGDGAKVTLDDGISPIDPISGLRSTHGRVKDSDVQAAANGLWAAGAEAISVNGQRLTVTSTIRQAGEAILVDFRPVTAPYVVVAIGPDDLADTFRDGYVGGFFRKLAATYGISFDVEPVTDVVVAAAAEPTLRFAHPSTDLSAPSSGGSAGTKQPSAPVSPGGAASVSSQPATPSKGGR